MTIDRVIKKLGFTNQFARRYKQVFMNNPDTITIIRHQNHNAGNIFNEYLEPETLKFDVLVNINPQKQKVRDSRDDSVIDELRLEVYTYPGNYPEGLEVIDRHDLVEYQGKLYKIEDLEDVSLNGYDNSFQHFFIKLIN